MDAHAFAEVDVAWVRRKSGARVSLAKLFVLAGYIIVRVVKVTEDALSCERKGEYR